jgi:uncharacterized glyoxalase superfamily protein PhnB
MRWLESTFGFRERAGETMRSPEGQVVHAAMELASARIMLGSPGAGYRNPLHLGGTTQNLYVYVDNLDEHYAHTKRADAKLLTDITSTFYGDRRYGVQDLEGHHWYFAQTAKKVAVEDWKPTREDLKGHY